MTVAPILNAGTGYDLEVDVGYPIDALTLDDSVRGVLDSSSYVLDGTTTFASIIDGTTSIRVKRGRQDTTDAFPVGTMTFTLNDKRAGGVFNPFDDSPTNPYYDQTGNVPGIAPGRAVRLIRRSSTSVDQLLFVGFIVNYDLQNVIGQNSTVSVLCADRAYRLAQTSISAHTPTAQTSSARISAILDRAEVNYPSGAARNIASGGQTLGAYAIAEGTNVKSYFDQITESAERGRIFIDRSGVLKSETRIGATFSSPSVIFSDTGSNVPYREVQITFGADQIVNRVRVTPVGGTTETEQNTASQTKYFIKTVDISNSLLSTQTAADTLATYLLEPEPEARFTAVETWLGRLTALQRDAVATVDIGNTIQITRTIPFGTSTTAITQELAVEGIEHTISTGQGHSVRFYTSPTTLLFPFTLDSATLGTLDGLNALT